MKPSREKYRPIIMASLVGQDGSGKTETALTGPKPMAFFHIDPNTEQTVEKAIDVGTIEREDVTLYPVSYPAAIFKGKDDLQDLAVGIFEDEFLTPLEAVISDDAIKCIVLDTATELFELQLMADHGKLVQILPELRTKTNYKFKMLLNALKRSGKHVILLHRAREVWGDVERKTQKGVETTREKQQGMFEREGFGKTGFHVNVEAFLTYQPARGGGTNNQYGMRIDRCTQRPALVTNRAFEKEFWNLDDEAWWWGREKVKDGKKIKRVSFQYLALQMYPDIDIDQWS